MDVYMVSWKNKKVFITGGAGVIGTALVDQLLQQGADLLVGDLKPQPQKWEGALHYLQKDLVTMHLDEIQAFGPECYFHLAATFERSEESYPFWEENFHHNIHLSHHLMTLLKDLPTLKKIVFASSYLIYDPSLYFSEIPAKTISKLQEKSVISPRNLCGMAKLYHEKELSFLAQFKPHLQIISARIFRSYGKNSRDIISRWIQAALNEEIIYLYRPEGKFDFIYAEDVALGLIKLAETSFSGVVNLGTGHSRSIEEVIQLLKLHFRKLNIQPMETQIPIESSEANMDKFFELTNWNSFRQLEQTIPEIISSTLHIF
jgi:carbamoyl-phosphate synthase large subunit